MSTSKRLKVAKRPRKQRKKHEAIAEPEPSEEVAQVDEPTKPDPVPPVDDSDEAPEEVPAYFEDKRGQYASSDDEQVGETVYNEEKVDAKNKKRKRKVLGLAQEKDEEELALERALFGGAAVVAANSFGTEFKKEPSTSPSIEDLAAGLDSSVATKRRKTKETPVQEAAWVDEDDATVQIDIGAKDRLKKLRDKLAERRISGTEYQARLRAQHQKLAGATASWAIAASEKAYKRKLKALKKESQDEDASDSEASEDSTEFEDTAAEVEALLATTASLTKSIYDGQLPPTNISIGRLRDANIAQRTNAVVQVLQFHPNGQILAVAGLDKSLRLFEIDGKTNAHLQTVYFESLPITCAHFSVDGKELYVSGESKRFYVYNVVESKMDLVNLVGQKEKRLLKFSVSPDSKYIIFIGDGGHLIVVSNTTKQWVTDLFINGKAVSGCFSPDSQHYYALSERGDVYVYEMESRRCIHKFKDEGCIVATCIAISPDGRYLAIGQNSGIVNIYDLTDERNKRNPKPKPVKAIGNLVTSISGLVFNHDSQILAIFSSRKRNALKLVHLRSLTVFQNWPKENTPLGRVSAVTFSPNSGYLAVGNIDGRVRLFKLHYYYSGS